MFKIGDKVRILSDALCNNRETVLEHYNVKSAIGDIGKITKIYRDGDLQVDGLSSECGSIWRYKPEQLELVNEADQPQEEFEEITPENIIETLEFNQFHNNEDGKYKTYFTSNEECNVYIRDNATIGVNNDSEKFTYSAHITEMGDLGGHISVSDFHEFIVFVQKRIELNPLPKKPKKPKDILDWWEGNKVDGFDLYDDDEYYILEHDTLTYIPKSWAPDKQIEFTKTVIKFWSEK